MIPERLIRILRSVERPSHCCFPPSEIFNEGWMLRLVLDATQSASPGIASPLRFEPGARWTSEACLASPFAARRRADALAEGATNADGVVGHVSTRAGTRAGLVLAEKATQFVVVEAKMFSNLSSGARNASGYDQAARTVACMAETLKRAGRRPESVASLGFYIAAPQIDRRRRGVSNLESSLEPGAIRCAVAARIDAYGTERPAEEADPRAWERDWFLPLVDQLARTDALRVLTWEDCIAALFSVDRDAAREIEAFYRRCREEGALPSSRRRV